MTPSRLERLGIALTALGAAGLVVATAVLAGWPWGLIVAAVWSVAAGVLLVRTAALAPDVKPEGGAE